LTYFLKYAIISFKENNMSNKSYKNHHLMKLARIQVMDRFDGNCVMCGNPAWCIHHCDGTYWNHSIDNLISVCASCHFSIFHANGKPNSTGIAAAKWDDKESLSTYHRKYYAKFLKKEGTSQKTGIRPARKNDPKDKKRYTKEYYMKFVKKEKNKQKISKTGISPPDWNNKEDRNRYAREYYRKFLKLKYSPLIKPKNSS